MESRVVAGESRVVAGESRVVAGERSGAQTARARMERGGGIESAGVGGGGGGEGRKMPKALHFLIVLFEYFEEMALCRRKLVGMCRAGCACLSVSVQTRARFCVTMA